MDVVDITDWASKKVRTIDVTQDVAGVSYKFNVRRFVPKEGDAMARKWKTNGKEQAFECAPYGIASMAETGKALAQTVDLTTNDQLNFYIDESDKLMRNTYVMASRYSLIAEVRMCIPFCCGCCRSTGLGPRYLLTLTSVRKKDSFSGLYSDSGARLAWNLDQNEFVARRR